MSVETILRAWRDPYFRATLSADELAGLPQHPSGEVLTKFERSEFVRSDTQFHECTACALCCQTTA